MPATLSQRRVTVMGLGRFGGGEGAVGWLLDQGAEVLVTDLAPIETLQDTLARIESATGRRPEVHAGGHAHEQFTQCDLVVVNPAVPRPDRNPFLQAATDAGVPLTTASRLLVERLPDRRRVIGLTGTVGKSTTASMLHHALMACGLDARLGGNIGSSLLPELHTITPDTWIVLELSSAQLHWLGPGATDAPPWSPGTAITTNITANHLDWHGDEAAYRAAKAVIHRFQQQGDVHLHGPPDDGAPIQLRLPGEHNQQNARLAVAAAAAATGIAESELSASLASFDGLPHRLQPVDDGPSPRIWNDAKSSTPQATLLALDAFADQLDRVHLIAGGFDKGVSLDALARRAGDLAGLYCIGATGAALAASARSTGLQTVFDCGTLDVAVRRARERLGDDGLLLLSPACASWDQYPDFRSRGEHFLQLVAAPISSCSDATP